VTNEQQTLAPLADPERSAVVVIDVQNAFTDLSRPKYPPVEDVLPRMRRFIEEARRAAAQIIWIQVTHPDETNSDVWLRQHARRSSSYLQAGSSETAFHDGFGPQTGDLHVVKHRYSAFVGTPLELILRSRAIETVVVCGLTTDVCVSSTARDAFQRDFDTITLSDCTAEVSRGRHESGLETLAASFGRVCSSNDVLAVWQTRLVAART
jgi:ureidoacrylate peracid hydrolase